MITKNKNILIVSLLAFVFVLICLRFYSVYKEGKDELRLKLDNLKKEVLVISNEIEKDTSKSHLLDKFKEVDDPMLPTPINGLRFRSTNNDFEDEMEILQTNYEISYHTFDPNNKTITMRSKLKNGQWKNFTYKWTKVVEPHNNGYFEYSITNDKGVYQIWVSAAGNIGYEFYNKTKLVYYDVQQID